MKFRPVRTELSHADGRIDMTKLTVAFRNFAKAPKNEKKARPGEHEIAALTVTQSGVMWS